MKIAISHDKEVYLDEISFLDRFKYVGECLEWQGALSTAGYGAIRVKVRTNEWDTLNTHRVMYALKVGPMNDSSKVINHICCNRKCANIDHLEYVTDKVNVNHTFKARSSNKLGIKFLSYQPAQGSRPWIVRVHKLSIRKSFTRKEFAVKYLKELGEYYGD